jgi:NAD-dependent dihydropyrimidine dehydrogenase PreA subunit
MSNKLNSKVVLEKTKKVAQACKGDACAICVKECLMLNEYMIAPKMFFTEVLKSQSIDPEIPFSCTQCGYKYQCQKTTWACPVDEWH